LGIHDYPREAIKNGIYCGVEQYFSISLGGVVANRIPMCRVSIADDKEKILKNI